MIRTLAGFAGVLCLSACTPLSTPTQSILLGDGEVIATAPAGYCVDGVASQTARDFAILAPCATMSTATALPDVVGFATMQVGPAASGSIAADEPALRDYLISQDGARLLSQSDNAQDVDILSSQAFNNQVMIYFSDDGPPPFDGLQNEEWRGFTSVNGRLVTIGVRGLAMAPLREGPGATLLKLILAGVAAAADTPAQVAPDA